VILLYVPGRSTNDKSATSGPLIAKETQFIENVKALPSTDSSSVKNFLAGFPGFKIASWALRIRSSTCFLSWIGSPKISFFDCPSGWPLASVVMRNDTVHFQGWDEYESLHSVGQRVHVPEARGRVIPEIDSMREDFPADWIPTTAIWGRSMSSCTLMIPLRSVLLKLM